MHCREDVILEIAAKYFNEEGNLKIAVQNIYKMCSKVCLNKFFTKDLFHLQIDWVENWHGLHIHHTCSSTAIKFKSPANN